MTSDSLRFHLRRSTQAAHETLDGLVGTLDRLERYRCFLRGSHAHRAPVEAALHDVAWPAAFGTWRPGRLAAAIGQDLDDLALTAPAAPAFALSNDIASLIGVTYVLEGSALGARLIFRSVSAMGLDGSHGARHLALQSGSLDNWRGLLAIMDEVQDIDRDAAVRAADATFAQATCAMMENGFP